MVNNYENKFVDAGGIRTRYVEAGEGHPVILIHGGGAGADGPSNWGGCLPLYAPHVRAIAPDMVGFGETDQPDPDEFEYTQATRTEHIINFIDALGLEKVSLIGNSMGGSTAFGVALARPDLVSHLVLMGAAVNMTSQDMHDNRPKLAPVLAYDGTPGGMRTIIDHLTYSYEPSDELVEYRYKASVRPAAQAAYKAIMSWVGRNGLAYSDEEFASIQAPTLVVSGKNDIMIPVEKMYQLIGQIPGAWGYIIPNCGHWVMVEYPREFTDVTLRFIQEH